MNLEATEKDSLQFVLLQSVKENSYKTDADLFKNKQTKNQVLWAFFSFQIHSLKECIQASG